MRLRLWAAGPLVLALLGLAWLVVAVASAARAAEVLPAQPAPLAQLPAGLAEGVRLGQVEQFLGLPYGVAQRWSASLPAPAWQGRRAFQTQPPRCPQSAAGLADGSEREDCLYLNVYRPAAPSAQPRAVLVYVHGGGATGGGAGDHDGSALAQQGDIVVVSINYRLGALGFLNSPLLARQGQGGAGGNYALQDVLLALDWVRRSIAGLGGDPARVTLAGESAGGTVICPLLAAPQARGLFRAAIISSDDCLHDVDTPAQARQRAELLQHKLGCKDGACLRQAGAAQLLQAGGGAAPSIGEDGAGLLPDFAVHRIARHDWLQLPLLLGANRDEGRIAGPAFFRYDERRYQDWLAALLPPAQAALVSAAYRTEHAGDPLEYAYKISAVLTDSGMRGLGGCGMLPLARAAAADAPVYFYQFEDGQSAPDGDRSAPGAERGGFQFGAAHAAELPYLWRGGAFSGQLARWRPAQRRLSDLMIAHWAAFVRNGSPELAGQAAWPSLQRQQSYRALRPDASVQLPLAGYASEHRCALWQALPVIMARGEALP